MSIHFNHETSVPAVKEFELSFITNIINSGNSLMQKQMFYIKNCTLQELVYKLNPVQYFFHKLTKVVIQLNNNVLLKVNQEQHGITIDFLGIDESIEIAKEFISTLLVQQPVVGSWITDIYGNSINVPIDQQTLIPEAYPNIDVDKVIDGYFNSQSSVLFLQGPPGTGKTSFIRYLVSRWKSDGRTKIYMVYNADVASSANTYSTLLEDDKSCGILLEDIDSALGARSEGNKAMSQMLNLANGIFSLNKKIIISTNLPLEKIDQALLRPGRCYSVLEFNLLSKIEANALADKLGIKLGFEKEKYSLAEVYTNTPVFEKKKQKF